MVESNHENYHRRWRPGGDPESDTRRAVPSAWNPAGRVFARWRRGHGGSRRAEADGLGKRPPRRGARRAHSADDRRARPKDARRHKVQATLTAVDSSVLVPACAKWHEAHEVALRA